MGCPGAVATRKQGPRSQSARNPLEIEWRPTMSTGKCILDVVFSILFLTVYYWGIPQTHYESKWTFVYLLGGNLPSPQPPHFLAKIWLFRGKRQKKMSCHFGTSGCRELGALVSDPLLLAPVWAKWIVVDGSSFFQKTMVGHVSSLTFGPCPKKLRCFGRFHRKNPKFTFAAMNPGSTITAMYLTNSKIKGLF